jgi:class 3 adenylate cyclase
LLDAHEALAERAVVNFGGVVADFAGDGLLASFDGPARAVRCAFAFRHQMRSLGLEMRAGLHTGEVERRGDRVAGTGVHIASRIIPSPARATCSSPAPSKTSLSVPGSISPTVEHTP